jgi:hypothetical protein
MAQSEYNEEFEEDTLVVRAGPAVVEPSPASVRPKAPTARPKMPAFPKPAEPVKDPRRSTTNEDESRADDEGMAPVPAPRHHVK